MADASQLGILPPSTVRIDMDGWVQDWPWDWVHLKGDRVNIVIAPRWLRWWERLAVAVFYPYEHARELEPGRWIFHGREDFTIEAGPPQAPSMDTAGPQ